MLQQHLGGKKFVFSTLVVLMGVFLFAGRILFAKTLPAGSRQRGGQADDLKTVSNFNDDVRRGLQSLAVDPAAQVQQKAIESQDYKSTWDEFGTNMLVDGAMPPLEIDIAITNDIIQTIQTEERYNQKESQYLETMHTTPEEIQAMEEPGGSDVPPGEFIDPNPSREANLEVSLSASEDQGQNNSGETASTENASTSERTSAAPESGTSLSDVSTSTEITSTTTGEITTSRPEASTSSDETIFDAILRGEQALENQSQESTPPPPESSQSEPPPTE